MTPESVPSRPQRAGAPPSDHPRGTRLRGRRRALVGALAASAVALTAAAPAQAADDCPNATARAKQNAGFLPGCRAYEKVSPADKNGADILPFSANTRAALDGSKVMYSSLGAFADAQESGAVIPYLGARGADGWDTTSLRGTTKAYLHPDYNQLTMGFADDLSAAIYLTASPLTTDAQADTISLFRRPLPAGPFELLTPAGGPMDGPVTARPVFADGSTDLDHVVFNSHAALVPGAPVPFRPPPPDRPEDPPMPLADLYEWVDGEVRLVNILPDGTPAQHGAYPGFVQNQTTNPPYTGGYSDFAVSEDGSRIFWAALSEDGARSDLYVRIGGAVTKHISASQRTTPDPTPGQPFLVGASADGSTAFFTSPARLTDDADCTATGTCLYAYEVDSGQLTFVAAASGNVYTVVGSSADGSSMYFLSQARLTPDAGFAGLDLYRWHAGAVTHVADLTTAYVDYDNGAVGAGSVTHAAVSRDGNVVQFRSTRAVPGYDTGGHAMMYRYDAVADSLDCMSCRPDGAPATGDAATVSASSGIGGGQITNMHRKRSMSDDGSRVFFETPDPLVPQDVNEQRDVYVWEDGGPHLISTGRDPNPSYFGDASASGDQVFIVTRERLVGWDTDGNADLYDVRVGGGLPEPVRPPAPCSGDACLGPQTKAPQFDAPSSEGFTGAGDARPGARAAFAVTALSAKQRGRLGAGKAVSLRVRVNRRGRVAATGTARIGKRSRTVLRASRTARRAGSVTLALRLSALGRQRLARSGSLRVSLTTRFAGSPEPRVTVLRLTRASGTGKGR